MDDRVSIIIPAYNAAAFLAGALDSARAQSHADLDIVVVDDGSVDDTAAVARDYAGRDPRVRLVAVGANRGVHQARLAGLREARGTFTGFLDADDRYRPGFVAAMLRAIHGAGDGGDGAGADLAECDFRVVVDGYRPRAYARPRSVYARRPPAARRDGRRVFADLLCPDGWHALWNRLYRTGTLRRAVAGLPPELRDARLDVCEDLLLNAAFALEEPVAVFTPERNYDYVLRAASTSQARGADAVARYFADDRRALDFVEARLCADERRAFAEKKIAHARAALGYLREFAVHNDPGGGDFMSLLAAATDAYGGHLALAVERDPYGVTGRRGAGHHVASLLRHAKRRLLARTWPNRFKR